MYILDESDNVFHLTGKEILWDKITWQRLLDLIAACDKVVDFDRDSNNYGEFRFVTIVTGNRCLTAYGHGYHEHRECHLLHFTIFGGNDCRYVNRSALDKTNVLTELWAEHGDYASAEDPEPSEHTELFSMLADL